MSLLVLILVIPIFCIGCVMFTMTMYQYIMSDMLDVPLLSIGLVVMLIMSYFIIKLIFKSLPTTANILNQEKNINSYYNIFTFILMFIFGLVLLIKAFLREINLYDCGIGIMMLIMSAYAISILFHQDEEIVELVSIDEYDEKIKCLTFSYQESLIEYYSNEELKLNRHYKVKMNKKTKAISTIYNEVHNID